MKKINPLILCGFSLFCLFTRTNFAQAQQTPLPEISMPIATWPEVATVQELLRLDAKAALATEQDRLGFSNVTRINHQNRFPKKPQADRIVVKAIYGTGQQLSAEIQINDKLQHYLLESSGLSKSHSLPSSNYVLVKIENSCVYLKKNNATQKKCLKANLMAQE